MCGHLPSRWHLLPRLGAHEIFLFLEGGINGIDVEDLLNIFEGRQRQRAVSHLAQSRGTLFAGAEPWRPYEHR